MTVLWYTWKDLRHPLAGGAERVGHEWRRRLVAEGHHVRHVTARYAGSTEADVIEGVETIRRGTTAVGHYPSAVAWHRRAGRPEADVIIEEVNTIPYFVGPRSPRERLVRLYFQLAREIWFYQTPFPIAAAGYAAETAYTWLQSRRAGTTITISEDSRRDLARFGFDPSRVDIVHVGIDNRPLDTVATPVKEPAFTVLFHGSLRAMKRPIEALRGFHAFIRAGGRGQLWISGGGDDRPLRRYAARHGLTERVTFFGRTSEEEKLSLMRRASVLVATSVKEGWGLIVTEANSMGTPAIAYDVDGLRSAAGTQNWLSLPLPASLGDRLRDADAVFHDSPRYAAWCTRVLEDSRQYTHDASYRAFLTAIQRQPS